MVEVDEDTIVRVWDSARAVGGLDSAEWREDECGAWIRRSQYGHADDEFGWKIVYTRPGLEEPRAFHVANEFDIAAARPHCRVTADRRGVAPTTHVEQPRNRPVTGAD